MNVMKTCCWCRKEVDDADLEMVKIRGKKNPHVYHRDCAKRRKGQRKSAQYNVTKPLGGFR